MSLGLNFFIYRTDGILEGKLNRPYIEIDASTMRDQLKVRHHNPAELTAALENGQSMYYNNSFSFDMQNVGKLPARYSIDVSEFFYSGMQNILPPENNDGIIFPNQKIQLKYDLYGITNLQDNENDRKEIKRMKSFMQDDYTNASKIKIFYGYVDDENLNFETLIEERIAERNCDKVSTPGLPTCYSKPEWVVKVIK